MFSRAMFSRAMFSRAIFGFSRCTWPKIAFPPCDSNLEMACVPTNSMILVILNPILRYVRPSEADIGDCGMRKRAWPLAQIAQHEEKKPPGIF